MYGNKPECPGGRRGVKQKPSKGGVWKFSGTTQCTRETGRACCLSQGQLENVDWTLDWTLYYSNFY